jgi:hypothetical protein
MDSELGFEDACGASVDISTEFSALVAEVEAVLNRVSELCGELCFVVLESFAKVFVDGGREGDVAG